MFSDLVSTVGLAERLSEHAYYEEVLGPFYEIAEEVITEHGGTMRPVFAGDEVVVTTDSFGRPDRSVWRGSALRRSRTASDFARSFLCHAE